MAFDEDLAERVRELLSVRAGYSERRMFGGIGFMLQGNMAVGVIGDDLMARVGAAAHDEALARAHVRQFDMTGRPMRGWVVVDAAGLADEVDLVDWVERGAAYAESLPPK